MIFAPAFQPIKDVGTGSFVAAEVLARWYDEGRVLTPSSLSSPPHWGWWTWRWRGSFTTIFTFARIGIRLSS